MVAIVLRKGGATGSVTCRLCTMDGTAVAGADYVAVDQTLIFAEGETRKEVNITVVDDGKYENDEVFKVLLSEPTGGAMLMDDEEEVR